MEIIEIIYVISSIVQSLAVSLGVGVSTVAVVQFFVAIADGKIDEHEKKMMKVTYTLLRVAMGLILITTAIQAGILYRFVGEQYINPLTVGVWVIMLVLFVNAVAMTKHWIPSTFGPGIQAGSWYSLGVLLALMSLGLTTFTYIQFGLVYLGAVILMIAIINTVMNKLKS